MQAARTGVTSAGDPSDVRVAEGVEVAAEPLRINPRRAPHGIGDDGTVSAANAARRTFWRSCGLREPHGRSGSPRRRGGEGDCMTEIIFEVTEDDVDGGYSASALGHGIHTQGDSVEEIRRNVKEAVDCYFDDTMPRPKLIRLHFVRDEVLVA